MGGRSLSVAGLLVPGLLVASHAAALDGSATQGHAFARENCARCHAVGSLGASPMREAPPFRMVARRFPIDVLVEGVERRHPAMPDFRLDPGDAADLTAYLKALGR